MMRAGLGFDLHPLVSGRPLVLGGVTVPAGRGLDGHSDADVLTHAICEAALGALALGDLGQLFPDTDPRYAGVSSLALLHALAHIELNAIDLAWDIIARFAGWTDGPGAGTSPPLPRAFFDDWIRVADDEARHARIGLLPDAEVGQPQALEVIAAGRALGQHGPAGIGRAGGRDRSLGSSPAAVQVMG